MATNGSETSPPTVQELIDLVITEERRQMATIRREVAEVFKKYEKIVKDQLGLITREAHKVYEDQEVHQMTEDQIRSSPQTIRQKMEEKVKEMKDLKKKVEDCLKDLSEKPPESQDKTSKEREIRESEEWKKTDKTLETVLEDAAINDKGEDFEQLPETYRKCLLCLSIFPLGTEISKRVLIYWWIGEGFVASTQGKTAEEAGEEYFRELLGHEFIHPVYNKRSGTIVKCSINPWIHWMLISKARKIKFFDFDETGTAELEDHIIFLNLSMFSL